MTFADYDNQLAPERACKVLCASVIASIVCDFRLFASASNSSNSRQSFDLTLNLSLLLENLSAFISCYVDVIPHDFIIAASSALAMHAVIIINQKHFFHPCRDDIPFRGTMRELLLCVLFLCSALDRYTCGKECEKKVSTILFQ